MLDLKVINGTLFIPGVGLVQAGVGVKDGKLDLRIEHKTKRISPKKKPPLLTAD